MVAVKVNWEEFLERHDLIWERLPAKWTEAPHFGNALIGSMLYIQNGNLVMQIFRDDVRDHRDDTYGWPAISRPKFGIGFFTLNIGSKILDGKWRLDLWNARLTGMLVTDKGDIHINHYVHADEMVIITELWTDDFNLNVSWDWKPIPAVTTRGDYPKDEKTREAFIEKYGESHRNKIKIYDYNPEGRLERRNDNNIWIQDMNAGGQYATAWKSTITKEKHHLHITSIANTYPDRKADVRALSEIESFNNANLEDIYKKHQKWWHSYYPQSFISLPDPRLEALYWNTIYRYGATARFGRNIVQCSGLWFQGSLWPYITTDYNIQAAHWALYAANRLEQSAELVELLHRNTDNLIKSVSPESWQTDSAYLGISVADDFYMPRDSDKRWANVVGNLPFAMHNAWWQYRYTMDDEMLKFKIFPLLKRAINLYLHMLEKGEDGKLHMPPTISPESGEAPDCNFDLALLRWGCKVLIWSCNRLQIDDPLRLRWQEVLDMLVDFQTDGEVFLMGRNTPQSPGHRHGSHMIMIYPLFVINIDKHKEQLNIMKQTVKNFNYEPKSMPAMISTFGSPAASAIGDGEEALHMLNVQEADLLPNGLWWQPPCIESTLSAANNIQTMLLQSWGDTIRIFPAVPDQWENVVFHDLRAEGAFLVSAERKLGKTQWIRVKSLKGEPCRLKTGMSGKISLNVNGKISEISPNMNDLYILDLYADEEAILYPSDQTSIAEITPIALENGCNCRYGLQVEKIEFKR